MAEEGFTIEVSSSYGQFWRYNIIAMCGCFDAEDHRTDFVSTQSTVATVGANLAGPPQEYNPHRILQLTTLPADHIVLYIYLIPHTLPQGRDVSNTKPFPVQVHITAAGNQILKKTYPINQWSGASIELKLTANPTEQE